MSMANEEIRELLDAAHAARARAYAPYSGFSVGAALLGRNGKIYTGCNIENASYGGTVCAERVALGAAVADGVREFWAIAIVGGRTDEETREPCLPCGICRQVLSEFCPGHFPVYLEDTAGVVSYRLDELLPHSFAL